MNFKFQYLKPREDLIRIIEKYEEKGFTASFPEIENLTEYEQSRDNTTYVLLNFKRHRAERFTETLSVCFPKDFFYQGLKYKDWMLREEFEELCAQDDHFYYVDCILAKDLGKHNVHSDVVKDAHVTHNLECYALGYFSKDLGWSARSKTSDNLQEYKYVCVIKNAPAK